MHLGWLNTTPYRPNVSELTAILNIFVITASEGLRNNFSASGSVLNSGVTIASPAAQRHLNGPKVFYVIYSSRQQVDSHG